MPLIWCHTRQTGLQKDCQIAGLFHFHFQCGKQSKIYRRNVCTTPFTWPHFLILRRRNDMTGRSHMQGGKNWILLKRLFKAGSSETLIGWKSGKPLMSLYGTEWRERGYRVSRDFLQCGTAVRGWIGLEYRTSSEATSWINSQRRVLCEGRLTETGCAQRAIAQRDQNSLFR